MVEIRIPLPGLKLVSLTNQREHWRTRARRAKSQRHIGELTVKAALRSSGEVLRFPVTVTITRIAPRVLDDDNLAGAAKSVRDGVADALGVDDRDPRVRWAVAQRKGKPREYGAEVVLSFAGRGTP